MPLAQLRKLPLRSWPISAKKSGLFAKIEAKR
jgi:hypothetical protein